MYVFGFCVNVDVVVGVVVVVVVVYMYLVSTLNACSYCQDAYIASFRPARSGGIFCANWKLDHDIAWDPCANWNVSTAYS